MPWFSLLAVKDARSVDCMDLFQRFCQPSESSGCWFIMSHCSPVVLFTSFTVKSIRVMEKNVEGLMALIFWLMKSRVELADIGNTVGTLSVCLTVCPSACLAATGLYFPDTLLIFQVDIGPLVDQPSP